MKQVVVQSYCDLHSEEADPVPATTEVTFEGRLLDVCTQHERVVNEQIASLVDLFSHGVEVEQSAPISRKRPIGRPKREEFQTERFRTCPDCGHVTPTRSALGQHVKQRHEKLLRDYDWST